MLIQSDIIIKRFLTVCVFTLLMGCSSSSGNGSDNPDTPEQPEQPPVSSTNDVDFWLTKADESVKLEKQSGNIGFSTTANNNATITVEDTKKYQTIDGFGFTLTGGSAEVINGLSEDKKKSLLQELFGKSENAISISYLRVSVGASDLNEAPFTYDDMPSGETDEDLSEFSLEKDAGVISLLKEIIAIQPNIKILASPWSAPVWMKDNNSFVGGSLQPKYYEVYAQYWVKYLQAMQNEGITIDALTPQNEPLHGGNNPSMVMQAIDQANFIKTNLGPALKAANLNTKIIAYDHNCDNPQYPITVLSDTDANPFVDGAAFHLYAGDIVALTTVHNAFPDKNVYFTEQYNSSQDDFSGTFKWHIKNVIIGSMRNWSKNALEWNLANNASFGPHTDGGCNVCKGALTINSSGSITRNVGYYIVAQASKFIPAGSVRIESNIAGNLQNVAFITPEGNKVLIVQNDGNASVSFNIKFNDEIATSTLEAGAAGTYIWK
ncbi:glycoside hydrolase family 30 beta sandwich domain-containing protein [Zhouia sp. PK063]|uniref:glycoside hydrolase family 30 protein n=1 Tax=Zhouia sp. PK063 TaxID=3373602 RepID=UPI00379229C0